MEVNNTHAKMDAEKLKSEPTTDMQPIPTSQVGESGDLTDLANEELTPAQNRRLLVKTNLVVLSIMMMASFLAFLDKVGHVANRLLTRVNFD